MNTISPQNHVSTLAETAEADAVRARVHRPDPPTTRCPCCGQPVDVEPVEILVRRFVLTAHETAVLRIVWNDRAAPISAADSFDLMYADDIDGGPSQGSMNRHFNAALASLRAKLRGSGVGIETLASGRHVLVLGGGDAAIFVDRVSVAA